MDHSPIGRSGPIVSRIGLGCNNFGGRLTEAESRPIIDRALDLGVTFFDTADSYGDRGGSETVLGNVLGARRKDLVLATKFGRSVLDASKRRTGNGRAYVVEAVEGSLRRLRTDWIDLYQVHFPDPATSILETIGALDDLVRQGKIRAFGLSNFSAAELREACRLARAEGLSEPVSVQSELSLIERDSRTEMLPVAQEQGVGLIAYRPLASGLLSGKYRLGQPPAAGTRLAKMERHAEKYLQDQKLKLAAVLGEFARDYGRDVVELAIAWVLAHSGVASVIPGASTAEQLVTSVSAAGWQLSAEQMKELDGLLATEDDQRTTR